MNTKRILIGGLAAGVCMIVLDLIANIAVLGKRYEALQLRGVFRIEPRFPFLPIWCVLLLGLGLGIAWLYAGVRKQLGPGPKTAVLLGLVVGLMAAVPPNFVQASWSPVGRFVALVWLVTLMVEMIVGALVAGALYQEEG